MTYQLKDRPSQISCAWCGEPYPVAKTGPLPMYCSASHKNAAYIARLRSDRREVVRLRRELGVA